MITNIKRNDCRPLRLSISKKSEDANYSALIWLPPYAIVCRKYKKFLFSDKATPSLRPRT